MLTTLSSDAGFDKIVNVGGRLERLPGPSNCGYRETGRCAGDDSDGAGDQVGVRRENDSRANCESSEADARC